VSTCEYERNESDPSGRFVGLPPKDEPADATTLNLTTSAGPLQVRLDDEHAPCTVRSMAFLARKDFYDGNVCHRMTTAATLKILQCGDPLGDGSGGPGYTIPDELPTDLADGEATSGQPTKIYPRGAVAMANAGPDTGGSQFFLVYADSTLSPDYTIFGELTTRGLTTLDQVAAGGVTPGQYGPEDGAPVVGVTIESASVS
jgi:peptidyl-prolyl cis-trans isomerase B (cyclophilin B)